jgi:hypothetical protein
VPLALGEESVSSSASWGQEMFEGRLMRWSLIDGHGGMLDQCVKIQQLTTVIAVLVRLAGDDDISMNFLC